MIKKLALTSILATTLASAPAMAGEGRPVDLAFCKQYERDVSMLFDDYTNGMTRRQFRNKYLEPTHEFAYDVLRQLNLNDGQLSLKGYKFLFVGMLTEHCVKQAKLNQEG